MFQTTNQRTLACNGFGGRPLFPWKGMQGASFDDLRFVDGREKLRVPRSHEAKGDMSEIWEYPAATSSVQETF